MYKVQESSLDWAMKAAILRGDTDLLPTPYEYEAIAADWQTLRHWLSNQDIHTWTTRRLRSCLVPKGRFTYRIATQFDPFDFLLFTALVFEAGDDLERHRLSKTQEIVLANRFDPDDEGRMFDSHYSWKLFVEKSNTMAAVPGTTHVVVADIADFYPRLYHHQINNTLHSAITDQNLAIAVFRFIDKWSSRNQSYGLPVGTDACRLIADVTISDIDQLLVARSVPFVRWVDDYRIFATSVNQAYEYLHLLANSLFRSHGLTLSAVKTEIVSIPNFVAKYARDEPEKEQQSLADRLGDFLRDMGMSDPGGLEFDDLPEELQDEVTSDNLTEMLTEQLASGRIDPVVFKYVLRRLGHLNIDVADTLLDHVDVWYDNVPEVCRYLAHAAASDSGVRSNLSDKIMGLLESDSPTALLESHRTWLLSVLASCDSKPISSRMVQAYERFTDEFTRRELTIGLGSAGADFWVRLRLDELGSLSSWHRRAAIRAGTCLPTDEKRHLLRTLSQTDDKLESVCANWARAQ